MTTARSQAEQIAEQIGSSLMPDNKVWTNRFTVESTSSSRTYIVSQRRTDGVWGCSCRGWINYKHCKHLDDMLHRLSELNTKTLSQLNEETLQMLASARTAYLDLSEPTAMTAPVAFAPDLDLRSAR
jgi:hypothetical protein